MTCPGEIRTCAGLRGRLLYHGPSTDFGVRTGVLVLRPEHQADLDRLTDLLTGQGHAVQRQDGTLIVVLDEARQAHDAAANLNRLAHQHGIVLAALHIRQSTLEDRFLALMGAQR